MIEATEIQRHIRQLAVGIGVRLAGSAGEQRAVDYIVDQFKAAGVSARTETFPIMQRDVASQSLKIHAGGVWKAFPCSLFSNTPGTDGREVEAPLAVHDAHGENDRMDLSHLTGKAVLHLGSHIESAAQYQRLIAAKPACMLFVDVRYPGTTALADGMFPEYRRRMGAVPTLNVAYQDAWSWIVAKADRARFCVKGGMKPATSTNVIAEIAGAGGAGAGDDGPVIFLSAHHDTQADSPGADDNASGVAALLAAAPVIRGMGLGCTVRLISFGAEEQLSVGSEQYVRAHRAELAQRGGVVINLDSIGSAMGWFELFLLGTEPMQKLAISRAQARGIWARASSAAMPYADHFPFAAAGVSGMTLLRPNCAAGRFFHHRPDDDMTRVDPAIIANCATWAAEMAQALAPWTKPQLVPTPDPQTQAAIATYWKDLFGGW